MNSEAERRNIDARYWGGVLLWAGMIFVIDTLDRLPQIGRADAWSWVFLGAGVYGLVMIYRHATQAQGFRPTWWDYVWSGFVTIVGLSGFFGVDLFWPLVLIVAALALLGKTWLPQERGDRVPE
jgi:hypothetical protein